MKKELDPLEKIIRPIVEGQIRGFLKEHPSVVAAVDWYKPRKHDKATTFTNSLSKRIVRDLTCPTTRARLEAALVAVASASQPKAEPGTWLLGRLVGGLAESLGRPRRAQSST